ncbi:glycerate kinase type-2 family protein [Deinococcus aquiradiocola]|uniref:Glycerate kinase n=1 Tax=Deinococcus aquiradiocola TaxID=393059 RepID=A0A917PCR3_9DEIO|nr:DUF4147 domain-containing protein [Deinococcus aquiradiocola]GGJ70817.1 hypothetical protein GCM10008939_14060 [Deinococcus aquiradiocola]
MNVTDAPRAVLERAFRAALAATDPGTLTAAHLPGRAPTGILAFGKAAPAMLRAALQAFPGVPALLVPPHGLPASDVRATVIPAGHPVPDDGSLQAGRAALALAGAQGADGHLLVLGSGGGSALLSSPWGVTPAQKQDLTRALLASGADIADINTVRKHLSRVKGGRLAAATSARVTALLLSDVIGDDPATIASGPTVPDPGTFADALAVLDRFGIPAPEARAHLRAGVHGEVPDTPKPGTFGDRVQAAVIGSGRHLLTALRDALTREGVDATVGAHDLHGEVTAVARDLAALVLREPARARPHVLLSGGEPTVTLGPHPGEGGRNHELALALALALDGRQRGVHALMAGSDGMDGTTGAAGAFVTPDTLARARAQGLDPALFLARHDSGTLFAALHDQLVTGPTGTNLNDVHALWLPTGP